MRLDFLRLLSLASVMPVLGAYAVETTVDLESYAHEMRITVSGYSGVEKLNDFPLLVRLSETDIYRFHYADFRSDGKDIRFALEDGTVLPHECDTWNPEGESTFWVKVPELTPGLVLRMRYGKANDEGAADAAEVWGDYAGVWHMNLNDGTVPESANGFDGTVRNAQHVTEVDGVVGGSYLNAEWHANNVPGVVVPSNETLDALGGNITFSVWLRTDGGNGYYEGDTRVWNNYARIFHTLGGSNAGANITGIDYSLEGNTFWLTLSDYGPRDGINSGVDFGKQWRHLVVTYGAEGRVVYIDGVRNDPECNANSAFKPRTGADWYFGCKGTTDSKSEHFVGGLDEIRIYNATITAERAAAEYAQVKTAGFLSFVREPTREELIGYAHEVELQVAGFGANQAPLSDFRLLVRVGESAVAGFRYADSFNDGKDFMFLLEDGTVLPFELETWNPQGESAFWVRVPEMRQGLKIRMLYGKEGMDFADEKKVWENYFGVWHMNIRDGAVAESANGYDGRVTSPQYVEAAQGVSGTAFRNAAWRLDDAPSVIVDSSAAKTALNGISGPLTFSFWVWQEGGDGAYVEEDGQRKQKWRNYGRIFNSAMGTMSSTQLKGADYALEGWVSALTITDYGTRAVGQSGNSFDGRWHQLVVTYGDDGRLVYVDGVRKDNCCDAEGSYVPKADAAWVFGRQYTWTEANSDQWVGKLDEYRVCRGTATPERIAAEYTMISTGSSYLISRKTLGENELATFSWYADLTVTGYAGETTLADFAVPVRLSPERISRFKYADMRADGRDLLFMSEAGELLDFDVACWNPQGESVVWVRVPALANGTKIRLYYGREEPWYGGTGVGDVWPSYAGVWHIDEPDDGAVALRDAAAAAVLTTGGAVSVVTNGVFGLARGSRLTAKNGPSAFATAYASKLNVGSNFTFSCWLRYDEGTKIDWAYLVGRKASSDGEAVWGVQSRSPNGMSIGFYTGGTGPNGVYTLSPGGPWYKLDMIYEGTDQYLYVNGRKVATTHSATPAGNDKNGLGVGGPQTTNFHGTFPGDIDEARYSAGVRSDDWMKAEYDAAELGATRFLTYGRSRVNGPPPGAVLIVR